MSASEKVGTKSISFSGLVKLNEAFKNFCFLILFLIQGNYVTSGFNSPKDHITLPPAAVK